MTAEEIQKLITPEQYERITGGWDRTEARRCELIEIRISKGQRTPAEDEEFRELQQLLQWHRRLYAPLPTREEMLARFPLA